MVFALIAGALALVGQVPQVEGNMELGLSVAGALNIALFGGLLLEMIRFRALFATDGPVICRLFDWLAKRKRADGKGLRTALCDGVVWPRAEVA